MSDTELSGRELDTALAMALGWKWHTFDPSKRISPDEIRWLDTPTDRTQLDGPGIVESDGSEKVASDGLRSLPHWSTDPALLPMLLAELTKRRMYWEAFSGFKVTAVVKSFTPDRSFVFTGDTIMEAVARAALVALRKAGPQ